MKAIILDYTDGTLLLVDIPKEWEHNPSEFVEALPCYSDQCYHMISNGDCFEVYNIVEDGQDTDGYPCYDYKHVCDL